MLLDKEISSHRIIFLRMIKILIGMDIIIFFLQSLYYSQIFCIFHIIIM